MTKTSEKTKKPKKRGRPAKRTMPPPIPDTPENIIKAVLNTQPKKREEWDYLKDNP